MYILLTIIIILLVYLILVTAIQFNMINKLYEKYKEK
jgi:hypothetical protein